MTITGPFTRAHSSFTFVGRESPALRAVRIRASGVVSSAQPMQSSICLVECGSVNRCAEEELEEAAEVGEPRVAVHLVPALVVGMVGVEVDVTPSVARREGQHGAMKIDPSTRSGCSAATIRCQYAPDECETTVARIDLLGVEHRNGIGGELAIVVVGGLGRAIRAAVAASVDGDHPHVACEIGHLRLPHPRVHDGPRRQEEQRARAFAKYFVADANTVAHHEPLLDRARALSLGTSLPATRASDRSIARVKRDHD